MSLTKEQRAFWDGLMANWRDAWGKDFPDDGSSILAVADYLAACEALLREIGAYCAPIAPGLDPVGKALYERIGPLLAREE